LYFNIETLDVEIQDLTPPTSGVSVDYERGRSRISRFQTLSERTHP
jgi:hypothetical protein